MGGDFEQLTREMMDYYLSCDPALATQIGWHKYDNELRDHRPEASARNVRTLKEYLAALEGIAPGSLSQEQLLDRDLAIHILRLKVFEKEELRLEERSSQVLDDLAYSLFFLFVRDVPSFDERMDALASRLEKVPEVLAGARASVLNPYRLWNEVSIETGEGLIDFILEIARLAEAKSCDALLRRRTRNASKAAAEAVSDHLEWMRAEVVPKADQRNTVTRAEYDRYLSMKEYGVNLVQGLKIAEAYMESVRGEMTKLASVLVPSGKIADALMKMKKDHPLTSSDILQAYSDSVKRAREYMIAKDLVSLPENERLVVMATPRFMLPVTPFAAQFEPGKFDGNRTGLFLVSLDEENPDVLVEHSHAGIANTTVHEGYPGHHLHGICSNTNPSHVRILISSPDFGEGWGLYSEQLMISSGYNDTALGRLTNLNDLLFRIARLYVEMRLVTGEMSIEEGADMFVRECGINPDAALAEARSCAMGPTYYSSYFIGKLGIEQLREEVHAAMGERFSLKFFHDSLVYSGCMPMPFMRRAVSLRLKREYGIELPERTESLFEYAMRKVGR